MLCEMERDTVNVAPRYQKHFDIAQISIYPFPELPDRTATGRLVGIWSLKVILRHQPHQPRIPSVRSDPENPSPLHMSRKYSPSFCCATTGTFHSSHCKNRHNNLKNQRIRGKLNRSLARSTIRGSFSATVARSIIYTLPDGRNRV